MVLQIIPNILRESFLNSNTNFTDRELLVAYIPISCLGALALHLRWRDVLIYVMHLYHTLGIAENFYFEGIQNIISNILHVVLVDSLVISPHSFPLLKP